MSQPWTALHDAADAARCGNKAYRLAQLARAGCRVLPGWVLSADAPFDVRALLDLHDTRTWILRSSSPLEDRAGASAAGIFPSVVAAAIPEDLEAAVARVRAAADDPDVRAALDADAIDVAVLAQPHVPFETWCTVETDGEDFELEGWDFRGDAPFRWTEDDDGRIRTACDAAREATGIENALLEVGVADDTVWILQIRPAPARRVRRASRHPVEDPVGLGPVVTAGDENVAWGWDHAHAPVPLCPLLATLFGRWIASSDGHYPSRLIDGRWHDRPRATHEPTLDDDAIASGIEAWDRAMDAVRAHLASLDKTVSALDGSKTTWNAFVDAWLAGQALYFDTPSGALRRAVAALESERDIRIAPDPDHSIAQLRAERWRRLASELDPESPLESHTLRNECIASGHLCALPYDGRAIPWEEDRGALLRAILRHRDDVNVVRSTPSDDPVVERARAIVTRAENDDDLLLQLYLRWRRAVVRIAGALEVPVDEVLDVTLDALERALEHDDPTEWKRAVREGRALAAQWTTRRPRRVAADTTLLTGRAASPGRVEGRVARAIHLGDLHAIGPDTIAVVESVLPADAVHVRFLGGLVCESGDVLGHASILAREAGIPCVVDVPDARRALARVDRVVLDGDGGSVIAL